MPHPHPWAIVSDAYKREHLQKSRQRAHRKKINQKSNGVGLTFAQALKQALALVDTRVHDHFIVIGSGVLSSLKWVLL